VGGGIGRGGVGGGGAVFRHLAGGAGGAPRSRGSATIRVIYLAAQPNHPSIANYIVGSKPENWHTNVPNYFRLRYHALYPDIDLIYYGNQRQLEYDLLVAPGANPTVILMQFEGTNRPGLSPDGDLMRPVRQPWPTCWRQVPPSFTNLPNSTN
jgi:hypothetical protein